MNTALSVRIAALLFVLLSCLGATGCARTNGATAPTTATKAALLINVTHGRDDLHAASMALSLAVDAAAQGHEVIVLLNVAAPELASTTLGEDVGIADFPPVAQMIRDLMDKGGRVVVCGHCAAVAKVPEQTLRPGVIVARPGEIPGLLKPGMVGLSY